MDDVPTGQPALALAQKVIERVTAAGLPADLLPDAITSVSVAAHVDAENTLRSEVLEFMDTVRRVEHAIAASRRGEDVPEELDIATLGEITEDEWRAHWAPEAETVAETEPAPDRIPEPTPADVPEPGPGGSARAVAGGRARADARGRFDRGAVSANGVAADEHARMPTST